MMDMLGNAVFRILCCTVLCGTVLSLFPEGRMKELLHTFSGIFLTVVLLSAVSLVELPEIESIGADFVLQAREAAAAGEDYAQQQYRELIKQNVEAYILDIARRNGWELTAGVEVDGDGIPVSVTLWGDLSAAERREMEAAVSEELGIAKEDLRWNG